MMRFLFIIMILLLIVGCTQQTPAMKAGYTEKKAYSITQYEYELYINLKNCQTVGKVHIQYFYDKTEEEKLNEAYFDQADGKCRMKQGIDATDKEWCEVPFIMLENVTGVIDYLDFMNQCEAFDN